MPGRKFNTPTYRYGFNGKEKEDEIANVDGADLDFDARIYDSRLGRWWAIDLQAEKYPYASPYSFCVNNPIIYTDPNGETIIITFIARKGANPVVAIYKDGKLTTKDGKEIKFNNEYIQMVKETLDNLKNLDERTKTVVSDLENDSKDHIISNINLSDPDNLRKGSINKSTPSGGTYTKFTPDDDRKQPDNAFDTNEGLMAHELKHGWNKLKGINKELRETKSSNPKISMEEVDAINFQNIVRDKQGTQLRDTWSSITEFNKINQKDLISPKNYKLQESKNNTQKKPYKNPIRHL